MIITAKNTAFSDKLDIAVQGEMLVNFKKTSNPNIKKTDELIPKQFNFYAGYPWAFAGLNNNYFNEIRQTIAENPDLSSGIANIVGANVAGGVTYARPDSEGKLKRFNDKNINKFLRDSNIDDYFETGFRDMLVYWNQVADIIRSIDYAQIKHIRNLGTSQCRLAWQNEFGQIPNIYVHPNWNLNIMYVNPDDALNIPLVDRFGNNAENIRVMKGTRLAYWNHGYGDEIYYNPAPWHSLINTKILSFSKLIWEYKEAFLLNQMSIKYLIEVADWWFEKKFGKDFWEKDKDEITSKMEEVLDDFNKKMIGTQKAGNSIISIKSLDQDTGKEYNGWTITPIDKGEQSNLFIEDSREVSSVIYRALQMDSSLVGTPIGSNGGSMGAGSGSDKKAADAIQTRKFQYIAKKVLAPLSDIAEYNGWGDDIVFYANTSSIPDQSEIPPAQRNDPNAQPNPKN